MDDVTFTAVSGASVESASSYRDVGTAATDPLIAYVDRATLERYSINFKYYLDT